MRQVNEYTLASAIAPRTITSSTDATPIVVTFNSHGLVTGDIITIFGHVTNTNANGTWVVTRVGANTFSLDTSTATGGGAGGNTGVFAKRAGILLVEDFKSVTLSYNSDGGGDAAFTVKCVGSISQEIPDFAKSSSPSNQYGYMSQINLEDASGVDGSTGLIWNSSDNNYMTEVNVNGIRWLSIIPTAGTAGEISSLARCFADTI